MLLAGLLGLTRFARSRRSNRLAANPSTSRSTPATAVTTAFISILLVASSDARADLAPGLYQGRMLNFGGQAHVYDLRVPPGYDGSVAVPLLVDLHAFSESPAGHRANSGFDAIAQAQSFIVVWPRGLGANPNIATWPWTGGPAWNAGWCCGDGSNQNLDDVGFIRALVASLETQVRIDPRRIYASGRSNGAALSHRLACEAADLFAGVAIFAAGFVFPDCHPVRPIPVWITHGRQDTRVPYDGGNLLLDPTFPTVNSVHQEFEAWRVRDGCVGASPDTTEIQGLTSRCEIYSSCSAGVKVGLCSVDGTYDGGHTPYWPLGVADGFNTQQRAWSFLSSFSLPATQPVSALSWTGRALLAIAMLIAAGSSGSFVRFAGRKESTD
jgi:polyhydroxybutyrate depolymerase